MIEFYNYELLWLLLFLLPLLYFIKNKNNDVETIFSKKVLKKIKLKNSGISKRWRVLYMILTMVFIIISLARPQLDNGEIKIKSSFINVVTAMDMSKSMLANDIYPNRFEFAKKKFLDSLDYFKKTKIAIIGFSTQTFLISPLTQDFNSLKFLVKHINLDNLSLHGTDIMTTLESANNLFLHEKNKILLMFTDGSDKKEFSKEVTYAKEHNIAVYIYNIGTSKGGLIKDKNSVLKDKNGNLVIVKRTDNIKELALKSGGAYMNYSLKSNDIKLLADTIQNSYVAKQEESSTMIDKQELFYYPLFLALLTFFIALFSMPEAIKVKGVNK